MSATLSASCTRDMVTSFGRLTVVDAIEHIDRSQYKEVEDGHEGSSRRRGGSGTVLCFGRRDSSQSSGSNQPGPRVGRARRPDPAPAVLTCCCTGRSLFV